MYLGKMGDGGLYEDDPSFQVTGEDGGALVADNSYYNSGYSANAGTIPNASGFNIDWGGIVSSGLKTWGQIETTRLQTEPQRIYAEKGVNPMYYQQPGVYPYGGLSPFQLSAGAPGTFLGISATWWLLGIAGIAAIIMLSDSGSKK